VLVRGDAAAIAAHFAALCALQPVRMDPDGLVCAPRCAPELAEPALARCPLPVRALAAVPGWPAPPAAHIAGWYRRGPDHLPAPAGVRELVQVPGEGFGPGDHATTLMCLEAVDEAPGGPALDAGCGSGLLAQAWVALGRGPVLACDLDPRALEQARRSLVAAGRAADVELRRAPLAALDAAEIAGRTLLANVPLPAHRELLSRVEAPPRAAILSGVRSPDAAALAAAWEAHGLAIARVRHRAGFACVRMEGG
jgi:ribosomal protein L11 methyltransferase